MITARGNRMFRRLEVIIERVAGGGWREAKVIPLGKLIEKLFHENWPTNGGGRVASSGSLIARSYEACV